MGNSTAHNAQPADLSGKHAIEVRISDCGQRLTEAMNAILREIPEATQGPQKLAAALGIDKVLASRVLKAMRTDDALCAIHRMPGPDPLRRFVSASSKRGADKDQAKIAREAIDSYEDLITIEIGDRSALEAVLSAWVPEARRDFLTRRKQSAYRAMSQLKGVTLGTYAETAFVAPSKSDETKLDIVWMKRLVGLERLRPHARVMLSSFRGVDMEERPPDRRPLTIDGEPIDSFGAIVVDEYSTITPGALTATQRGETVFYMLTDEAFGPDDAIDLCTVEVNREEVPRYVDPSRGRVAWFSSEVVIPARRQQLDVFVHRDLYNGASPRLRFYDTAITGIVDVNDPSSEMSELEMSETLEELDRGLAGARSSHIPNYHAIINNVAERASIDATSLRGFRCLIDYPLYGCQTAMLFPTAAPPAE